MKYDLEKLCELYKIFSPTGATKKMRKYIRKQCAALSASVVSDNVGNIYVTKGASETYPCVCAHIDQVQHNHSNDFEVIKSGDVLFGYSAKSKAQQGLGADDKNGIWIALMLLQSCDVLKCAFFVDEEVGCVGSSQADMDFFSDVRFVIEADRKNGGNLISEISGGRICSDEFLNDCGYEQFGYSTTSGLMTDVLELSENGVGVSCINFSCGYYHPHTDNECTSWSEICNALDFAKHIVDNCTKVYAHKYESMWTNYYYGGYRNTFDKEYDDKKQIREILYDEPYLTFDEMMTYYGEFFETKDKNTLRDMFDKESAKVTYDYYNNI